MAFTSQRDATPRDIAIGLLARREYSRTELAQRLKKKAFDDDAIDECLDALVEQGLQSDARFAASFVRSRILRGQGVIRIKGELRQRGVDQETLKSAFEEVEEGEQVDWFELARETLARRFDNPGETPKERARRERFLANRGFDFEQIRYALSCL
ncbi:MULTISPECIES: regulatory protein RecX [unclassified Halomonas]|uniref:regulatory protein RecX n=1 Tax=unclassified Halomonas TaxID=2609666 RepID=UPI0007D9D339|nr:MULTISPECIES: regulatory protein RecX [unclassified Halomonas]MBT2786690.1 regulatory protein RecX [Halomonas sp. ISL-106]MBT2798658.1 regulatory protein RecX [Halomonas sp. ISL-104]OAL58345.1 recombinase RecX [Halomonas sp. ALS9]